MSVSVDVKDKYRGNDPEMENYYIFLEFPEENVLVSLLVLPAFCFVC